MQTYIIPVTELVLLESGTTMLDFLDGSSSSSEGERPTPTPPAQPIKPSI